MCLGACGDKCSACPRYIATAKSDAGLLRDVLELYVRTGHRPPDTESESLKCPGCRENKNCAYPEVRGCVVARKLENCGQCASYPCEKIQTVFSNTARFKEIVAGKAGANVMLMFEEAFFSKKKHLDAVKEKGAGFEL